MQTIIECVPNFSEGRNSENVEAIVKALRDGPDVYILDREMDADHNRSVITLVGTRESIGEAALRGIGKAAELIDLSVNAVVSQGGKHMVDEEERVAILARAAVEGDDFHGLTFRSFCVAVVPPVDGVERYCRQFGVGCHGHERAGSVKGAATKEPRHLQ